MRATIGNATLHLGDCLEVLRTLPEASVQCCVTSPPYYGLRDYGHADQIGLEQSPEEYVAKLVAVFREVQRVLKDDGTLWLNLGDSYANGGRQSRDTDDKLSQRGMNVRPDDGAKPKDLLGIPWMLARALHDPYYTGPVKDVCDQVWLAAMLDAEGSICGTEYQTGDRIKTNIYISITNTSVPVIEKCDRLFPQDLKHIYEKTNGASNRKCFRWDVERMDQKALFLRTIYPHLVAKRKQAIIGYTFIEMQRGLVSKKKGYLAEQHEQRSWLMQALSLLNSGQDVDIPDWCIEPPSLFEPGYYLRQDIIWHKPNPMPESVRDRCTKAHEYIFLLSKSERYYYNHEAILEDAKWERWGDQTVIKEQQGTAKWIGNKSKAELQAIGKKNRRSVWTIATKPYSGAHFAVMPPALVEPCILAGSRPSDVCLDPFSGSGTVAAVAASLGRQAIGIELNPEYQSLAIERIEDAQRQPDLLWMAAA